MLKKLVIFGRPPSGLTRAYLSKALGRSFCARFSAKLLQQRVERDAYARYLWLEIGKLFRLV